MEIVTSWMEQGERGILLRLLKRRFGPVSGRTQKQIGSLSHEQLGELAEALLDFKQPSDLTRWLREHAPAVAGADGRRAR
jgi:hypothetical protein